MGSLIKIAIILMASCISAANGEAQAQILRTGAESVGNKALEFEFKGSYLETTGHFDKNGKDVALQGEESFSKVDVEVLARYGISGPLEFRTGLRGRQNTSVVDNPGKGGVFHLDSQGVESYFAGFKYAVKLNPKWNFAFDLYYRQSAFTNENHNSQSPYSTLDLGDDVKELGLGAHLSQRVRPHLRLFYSAIYQDRSQDYSSEILYAAQALYGRKNWEIFLGLEGIYSLKSDFYSGGLPERPPQNTGSTYLFNGTNRSYLAPVAGFHWTFSEKWKLSATVKSVLQGVSTDESHEGQLSLIFRVPGKSKQEIMEDSFKEYEVEASVVRVSPRGIFVKIDKGVGDDIQKGMAMDIYQFDYLGGNVLAASGVVYEVQADHSILKILRRYRNLEIKVGYVARGKLAD